MEADKAFHEEYKVKKKRQLLPYAAWMFVEEVIELVEIKPLKNSILGLPRVNGRLPEQRKRLTISVELVALSLIFMDEPTSGMQGLPPLLFLGHHIFKSVDEYATSVDETRRATEGVLDGHYPATWKLDVQRTRSVKNKNSFMGNEVNQREDLITMPFILDSLLPTPLLAAFGPSRLLPSSTKIIS
ncbi:hypothetical protein Bca101_007299 [Brassica carinata]